LSKYLFYAIGEIILVVIGILLALQINTWNLDRLARQQERIYLERIISDLETDLESLEATKASHEIRVILGLEILDRMGSQHLQTLYSRNSFQNVMEHADAYTGNLPETFGGKLFQILMIQRFYQNDHTFQEMLETGKIDLIRDLDLKFAIMQQYQTTKSARSFQDEIVMFIQHAYREALVANGISSINRTVDVDLIETLQHKQLLQVELENYVQISLSQLNDLIYKEGSLAQSTQQLIDMISGYLGNSQPLTQE
jgi:hypothetical protein